MCGIGGAISQNEDYGRLLKLILQDQTPRGPDHADLVSLDKDQLRVALAHNRLAILDLSEQGHQPFIDPKTGACLVFNGEIYNYLEIRKELEAVGEKFTSTGDTEVLMKALLRWGTHAYSRLNGMFAFALWSPKERTLTLARDRFGVKPCFYYQNNDTFAFASNTNALAKYFSCTLNFNYLSRGTTWNLYEDMQGSSAYNEIRSLPPGHFLELKDGKFSIKPFYDLNLRVANRVEEFSGASETEMQRATESALLRSVELRLRAHVPIALSLSGGLDSALVASLMKNFYAQPIEAFTFGALADPESEARLAQLTASHLGLKINFVEIPMTDLVERFEKTLAAQKAPFAHMSVMAQNAVSEAMHASNYRVSVGGQGADESFMGYRKFQFFYLRHLLQTGSPFGAVKAAWGLGKLGLAEFNHRDQLNVYLRRYADRQKPPALFRLAHDNEFSLNNDESRDLTARQIADVRQASLLTLLRYEDLNSMNFSVESRMPFLDYNVIETALALPSSLKIRDGYGKWILRRIGSGKLPEPILNTRAKRAFAFNPNLWLQGELGSYLRASIQPRLQRLGDVLTPEATSLLSEDVTYKNPRYFPLLTTAHWLLQRV